MKKIIVTSLSFALLLGLSACGTTATSIPERVEKTTRETSLTAKKDEAITEYDPLESVNITFDDWSEYPRTLHFNCNYSFEFYEERECVNAKIVSADSKEIIVELSVDEEKVADYFGDKPYILKNKKKEVTISAKDVYSQLMYSEDLSDETLSEIGNRYKTDLINAIDEHNSLIDTINELNEEIKNPDNKIEESDRIDNTLDIIAIYAVTMKKEETYLTDYSFIQNGEACEDCDSNEIEILKNVDDNPHQLWYAFKNKDNHIYVLSTSSLRIKNNEHDYMFWSNLTLDNVDKYDSLSDVKQNISDYISNFDNVQLEEINIPDSLK